MKYVDGFVLPLAEEHIDRYREIAAVASEVWKAHGALEYIECVGDDLEQADVTPFPRMVGCREGETVIFAWIVYRSRAHRDEVNAAVMQDHRMREMGSGDVPFDCGRMAWGGFSVLVDQ